MSVWARAADLLEPPVDPYLADPVGWVTTRLDETLWSKQRDIMVSVRDNRRTVVHSAHGAGKALALDTQLPTPTGWTTMGEASVGDRLIDERGQSCTVVAVSAVQYRPCYRVLFDDGTSIVAADDHQWQVLDMPTRQRVSHARRGRLHHVDDWRLHWAESRTVTTADMAADPSTGCGQRRWAIPCTQPLAGPPVDMPVPPYTLGAWLGDGTSSQAAITCHHNDAPTVIGSIEAEGVTVRDRPSAHSETTGCWGMLDGVLLGLRAMGVLDDKHIPQAVLRSDQSTRLAVLQGLMDTDGFAEGKSGVGIDLTCQALADGVAELVRTFGWKARRSTKRAMLYGVDCGTVYRLNFRPDLPVFRLLRKLAKAPVQVTQKSRHTIRTVVSVDPVESVPTRCVQVDSPSSLYLAGEAFVPTHNSHLAARIAAWWIECHPPGTAFVVSTAPSWPQVRAILWRYIGQVHRKGRLRGRVNQTEWWVGAELVGYGRKPPDQDEEGFQGVHAPFVLVLVDEAAGIPQALWVAILALLTTADCRVLAIGNPDYEGSEFSRMCNPGSGWNAIHIDGLATPNFTDEVKPPGAPLLDQTWIDDLVCDFGEGSPQYLAKVRGLFPADRTDGVVPWSWVAQCRTPTIPDGIGALRVPVELGVDVGGGQDLTVIRERCGPVVGRRWTVNTDDSELIVDEIMRAVDETQATSVKVDFGGIGFGVVGSLRRRLAGRPVEVVAVEFGASAGDAAKYINARAEMWWQARDAVKASAWWLGASGADGVALVDDRTVADLTEHRWFEARDGRIQLESKDQVRKRLGRSPDDGDALVLAFYTPAPAAGDRPAVVASYGSAALQGSR